ncbi:hypothetical protein SAMN04488066_10512 [Halorubrum aquaticum]|uniref:Uncharacterized protein n=1 Tax=Halorubrum aquaticum TaxID=387340 RepID=A0A1I3AAH9_9EURY|nr:hypothetical protein [Halorubrum aquaticum]SFH47123.1 hypothetical protein SAMN04488066_10512 [Halorubrum aquaticum]
MPSESGSAAETAETVESHPDPIEWGPVRHDRLRSIALGVGLVAALGLLAVVAVVAVGVANATWAAATGGGTLGGGSDLWVLAVLLLVGGPFSLLYLLIAYDRSTEGARERLRSAFGDYSLSRESIRPRWVLAGALPFGALWVWGPSPAEIGLFYLFPLIWFLPVLAGSKGTSVRLDPAERVVERTDHTHDRSRSDDLESVIRTRRIDLPWTTLFLLAYRGNAWYRSTPWLFVPSERADAVEDALEAVLARSPGPDRASVPERVVLAILGSSSLVVGLAMSAAGAGGGGIALGLLSAPFTLLFLALAARL